MECKSSILKVAYAYIPPSHIQKLKGPCSSSSLHSVHTHFVILQYLCECQFDDNLKFKTAVNDEDPERMRLQPIGRDRQGLLYWLQLDHEQNIRLYTEEQDDLDGSTWKCIVR